MAWLWETSLFLPEESRARVPVSRVPGRWVPVPRAGGGGGVQVTGDQKSYIYIMDLLWTIAAAKTITRANTHQPQCPFEGYSCPRHRHRPHRDHHLGHHNRHRRSNASTEKNRLHDSHGHRNHNCDHHRNDQHHRC